jgi:hypothetical protein
MSNSFTFSVEENTEDSVKVVFPEYNRSRIEEIFDSYNFNIIEPSDNCFIVDEPYDDVVEELLDYEIDEEEKDLLMEEDDGFYTTPLDMVYEILGVKEFLFEGVAKRTVAIRGGKRKILFRCGPGQMKVGRTCRRRPSAQLNKMKRRARVSARKARKKRRLANRKRKISMRRRSVLVRKKKVPGKEPGKSEKK